MISSKQKIAYGLPKNFNPHAKPQLYNKPEEIIKIKSEIDSSSDNGGYIKIPEGAVYVRTDCDIGDDDNYYHSPTVIFYGEEVEQKNPYYEKQLKAYNESQERLSIYEKHMIIYNKIIHDQNKKEKDEAEEREKKLYLKLKKKFG